MRKHGKNPRSKAIKELDTVASKACRERDKYICQRCGVYSRYNQAAHIFSRNNFATRWEIQNLICLCVACHIWWGHYHPVEFTEWIKTKLGAKKYNVLKKKANNKTFQFAARDKDKILKILPLLK